MKRINPYIRWMLRKIDIPLKDIQIHLRMFEILLREEFYYRNDIPLDRNRELGGLRLREKYMIETEAKKIEGLPKIEGAAGVLEVMVALAMRIDDEYLWYGQSYAGVFFMDMLSNLRLLKIDGFDAPRRSEKFNWNAAGEDTIRDILRYWLDREFEPDGYGSPFPLRKPLVNQRNVQIWDQAIAYIGENFR